MIGMYVYMSERGRVSEREKGERERRRVGLLRGSVLQCDAVCCSVMQCVAVSWKREKVSAGVLDCSVAVC